MFLPILHRSEYTLPEEVPGIVEAMVQSINSNTEYSLADIRPLQNPPKISVDVIAYPAIMLNWREAVPLYCKLNFEKPQAAYDRGMKLKKSIMERKGKRQTQKYCQTEVKAWLAQCAYPKAPKAPLGKRFCECCNPKPPKNSSLTPTAVATPLLSPCTSATPVTPSYEDAISPVPTFGGGVTPEADSALTPLFQFAPTEFSTPSISFTGSNHSSTETGSWTFGVRMADGFGESALASCSPHRCPLPSPVLTSVPSPVLTPKTQRWADETATRKRAERQARLFESERNEARQGHATTKVSIVVQMSVVVCIASYCYLKVTPPPPPHTLFADQAEGYHD